MLAVGVARLERMIRPFAASVLPLKVVVSSHSKSRKLFLKMLDNEQLNFHYDPPKNYEQVLWGLKFKSPLLNAAGMFKQGECAKVAYHQGAGGYLGGTGKVYGRRGNEKDGIEHPAVFYSRSRAASNWLGLPNLGDITSEKALEIVNNKNFPVGWSVMGPPEIKDPYRKTQHLIQSMWAYEQAGVDFLEINESCPNTEEGKPQESGLASRLSQIKYGFLEERSRNCPVIVKFSVDTPITQLPELMDLVFVCGFDGVNFGNTSVNYAKMRESIHPKERKLFDYFTKNFGGGISGKPLKESSLELAAKAAEYVKAGPPSREFHIIRTGGIDSLDDIKQSDGAGISLNQWYTGYFENFSKHGHNVYRELFGRPR